MYQCTVCSLCYPATHLWVSDVCLSCLTLNFSGAQPPLELPPPLAREMLEAYVDSVATQQVTLRQAAAITRMAAVWRRQAQEEP